LLVKLDARLTQDKKSSCRQARPDFRFAEFFFLMRPPGDISIIITNNNKWRFLMNIYVGNLSFDITEEALKEAFEAFGEVESVNIIKDRYSGQSRGFGFVEMPAKVQAQSAIDGLNGKELSGRPLNVNEARPRSDARRGSRRRF
jgi:RNA recognition motif-containing protein